MDQADAIKFLGADDSNTNVPPLSPVNPSPTSLGPPAMAIRPTVAQSEQEFRDANRQPGVDFDSETGASPWERFMLSFRRERKNQVKYLEDKYGPGTVRESSDGGLIVRIPDSENPGKSKDLLVDERKMSAKDFIDLAGSVPEIAASIYAVSKGKKMPFLKNGIGSVAKDIATATAGAEGTGLIKDLGMNVYDRGTLDLGSTANERAKMAGLDIAVGAISYPVARFFQWLKNPANSYRGQVQFDALAAQKYFKDKYGVSVPLSVGESTGMPLAARSEVFIEKMPGGTGPLRELKSEQEQSFRKLQEILMGNPGTDEQVGQAAIDAIRRNIEPTVGAETAARHGLGMQAQSAIESMIGKETTPARELYKSSLGNDIRQSVIAKRDAARAEADRLYGIAKSLPGGEGKVFDASGLQSDFKDILKSLPSSEQMVTKPVGLIDQFGNEIKESSKTTATLREFVPPNVLQRLEAVTNLKDAKFSLSDLQQMRREVYDDIAKGEGVPGLGTHYLADIGDALTKAIDKGVSSLPSGDLKSALQAANQHYKNQVVPFNRQGLTDLFRSADEPGFVSDYEVVSRLLGGDKSVRNWQLMKDNVSPPVLDRMRRAVADNILESSRLPGENTLDAKSFISNLYQFRMNYPEIAKDVFSGQENELFKQAKFLKYAQGDKIDEQQLSALLKDPNATADKLRILVEAERKKDEIFRNQIMKAIGSGDLNEQMLKPTEFVNRMLDKAEPKEVEQVLSSISSKPELVQDLRQKTFEKIFRDAARNATAEDVNRIMSGENTHILSGVKIADMLKNPTFNHKVKSILGHELYGDLTQYVKLQSAPEQAAKSFAAAGGIAAGTQIANLERRGPFAYLSDSMRNFIFSTVLTSKPLRSYLTRIPEQPGKWSLILSSPPFLEAVTKEFGKGTGADAFMANLKSAIDRSMTATPPTQRTPSPIVTRPIGDRENEWRQWLNGTNTIPATP